MLAGVLDYLIERHSGSTLLGFKGGPGGILAKDYIEITQENMVSSNLGRRQYPSCLWAAALKKQQCVGAERNWHSLHATHGKQALG